MTDNTKTCTDKLPWRYLQLHSWFLKRFYEQIWLRMELLLPMKLKLMYLSQQSKWKYDVSCLLSEIFIFTNNTEIACCVDCYDTPEIHQTNCERNHEGSNHTEKSFQGSILNHDESNCLYQKIKMQNFLFSYKILK